MYVRETDSLSRELGLGDGVMKSPKRTKPRPTRSRVGHFCKKR